MPLYLVAYSGLRGSSLSPSHVWLTTSSRTEPGGGRSRGDLDPVCIDHRLCLCLDGCFTHLCTTKSGHSVGCSELICLPLTLHALSLSGNFVRDLGLRLVTPSLQKMTNLHSLDLSSSACAVTAAGKQGRDFGYSTMPFTPFAFHV